MEITLDELLASREKRRETQIKLIHENPQLTLICLTVIMPGRVKCNSQSQTIAKAAVVALKERLGKHLLKMKECNLLTGYEAYFLTSLQKEGAKKMTCEIENKHPLGRLFDIAVIDKNGVPIPRSVVGEDERRCLICHQEARYCMRARTHGLEDLQRHIDQMVDDYVRRL